MGIAETRISQLQDRVAGLRAFLPQHGMRKTVLF